MPVSSLPARYGWLADEPGPRILTEFLKVYGLAETPGPESTPEIMRWAKVVRLDRVYKEDATAWCGLAMAYVAGQAGWEMAPMGNALWARNWAHWGSPSREAMLGDVLVFSRGSGGHVGIYIGEDDSAFHVLGGNQEDKVSIMRLVKSRCIAVRRCPWRINQPGNVRKIQLSASGKLSTDEA
jgi:uncharacterized protein (TIGR02594 family)